MAKLPSSSRMAPPEGVFQIQPAGHDIFNQMGNDFRVGFGMKGVALAMQLLPKSAVVCNDSVVNDGNVPRGARVGVGVFPADISVGRPTGMGDTDLPADLRQSLQGVDLVHRSDVLADFNPAVVDEGDATRIVSSVFQVANALKQSGGDGFLTDDA